MPVYTKALVEMGDGNASLYVVFLKNASIKQDSVLLASMTLGSLAQKMPHLRSVASLFEQCVGLQSTTSSLTDMVPTADTTMCVRGAVLVSDATKTLVSGEAVCHAHGKEFATGKPAVHMLGVVDAVPVQVTCLMTAGEVHERNVVHFIGSNECRNTINVAALNTGKRCTNNVRWQPFQSHYLRRKSTTETHVANFRNFGLRLLAPEHTRSPFFDVLQSQCKTVLCYSIFV